MLTSPVTASRRAGLFAVFDKSAGALETLRSATGTRPQAQRLVADWIASHQQFLVLVEVAPVKVLWAASDRPGLATGLHDLARELQGKVAELGAVQFEAQVQDSSLQAYCLDLWMRTQAASKYRADTEAPAVPEVHQLH